MATGVTTVRSGRAAAWFEKPPALRPGDAVAVVAPAGPVVEREAFEAGLAVLARRYRPRVDEGLFARARYLAGDDTRRLEALMAALLAEDSRAVFAARGGYGTMRLLPWLGPPGPGRPPAAMARPVPPAAGPPGPAETAPWPAPRLVVGFSDITALHLAWQAAGWVSVHGPVVTQLGRLSTDAADRLFALLEDVSAPPPALTGVGWGGGVVEGPLLGGNLSVLTRLLGTPYLPDLDGAILLLEDVSERPYRLDRMWTHLGLAGVLDRVRGIALGQFTDCEEPGGDYASAEVLRDLVAETKLPCVAGLPIGHGATNLAVPLGCRVRLDGQAGTLAFLEPAVTLPGPR